MSLSHGTQTQLSKSMLFYVLKKNGEIGLYNVHIQFIQWIIADQLYVVVGRMQTWKNFLH